MVCHKFAEKRCCWQVWIEGEQDQKAKSLNCETSTAINSANKSFLKVGTNQESSSDEFNFFLFRFRKFFGLRNKKVYLLYFYILQNKQLFQLLGKQFSFADVFPFLGSSKKKRQALKICFMALFHLKAKHQLPPETETGKFYPKISTWDNWDSLNVLEEANTISIVLRSLLWRMANDN